MMLRHLAEAVAALALFVLGCAAAQAKEPIYPSTSRFGLPVPSDMAESKRFTGFERKVGGAMVSIVELPGEAYPEVERSFTDESLKAQGFAVKNRETIAVDGGKDAVLYTGELPNDGQSPPEDTPSIKKWILLVKGGDVTGIIVAQMTAGAETEEDMRAMLTGVAIRPALTLDQQVDALPFRLGDMAGFRAVRVLAGNSVLLTRGPLDQMPGIEQPILILAQAVQQPTPAEQRDAFARAALYSNQTMKDFVIERSQGYRQSGSEWHELVARATDIGSGQPIVVSQTLRFAPDGYLRALGVVRAEQRDENLTLFRQVVDNLQPK